MRKSPSFDRFMASVLEPVTDAELVDTQYNLIARQARRAPWRRAMAEYEFRKSLVRFIYASDRYAKLCKDDHDQIPPGSHQYLLDAMREAAAQVIRTPAFQRIDIELKERLAKDQNVPIEEHEAREFIAADRAFFDAHPTARPPKRPRSKPAQTTGGPNV